VSGRTQTDRLAELASRLSDRDHAIVGDVVRLRFLTAGQLSRLHFAAIPQPVTRIRRVQRTLTRLVEQKLLVRLDRRVGGVRSGSSSYSYAPAAEGIRLVSYLAGDGIPRARAAVEPGTSFIDHTVDVNEIYLQTIEAERTRAIELLEHQAEPDCWRTFLGPIGNEIGLRPDAFIAVAQDEFEHRSFVEVDRGTEGSTALRRKLLTYVDYWRSGAEQQRHGIFPRVVWQVSRPRRAELLQVLIGELPVEAHRLFVVTATLATLACLRGADAASGAQP
jgi:hypothetical protein